jgi:hypothetical protein
VDFKREAAPVHASQPAEAPQQPVQRQSQASVTSSSSTKNSKLFMWGGIVLIAIVLTAGTLGAMAMTKNGSGSTLPATTVKSNQYQAVFLTNGQVYFGKLVGLHSDYLVLKNIYYLQVAQAIQPSDGKTAAAPANTGSDSNNVQLIKLGNELHGPEDQMQVSKDQVLFWENLKTDSKVAKAIENYKAEPTK